MTARNKLDALGEALAVGDDTEALSRPVAPPRSVRDVLAPPVPAQPVVPPEPPHRQRDVSATRRRSTAKLPLSVSQRADQAKARRWELSELLVAALERPRPAADEADRRLERLRAEPWVQRQYRLTEAQRELLDDTSLGWRMNRSEAIAVLLDAAFDAAPA